MIHSHQQQRLKSLEEITARQLDLKMHTGHTCVQHGLELLGSTGW